MALDLGLLCDSQQAFCFDKDQLVTHGVILGMTGSGKTGLAITLLESLIEQEIPLFLIDPKGDLANLGLLFPEASAEQLAPWASPSQDPQQWSQTLLEARQKAGLSPSRIQRLKDKLDLRIFTPGSRTGRPINLLQGFPRPPAALLEDEEARSQLIQATLQSLLALVEVQADPLRSPEALVLHQLVEQAWLAGREISLEDLLLQLVDPPLKKIGIFPLESFYPAASRLELAMRLNALLASPAFGPWKEGQPLDPGELVISSNGKVPVNLFYLAHLSDSQRMFFVSLLLGRLLAWSRSLPGSSRLQSLLFFDEVAGFAPPHPSDPPSKQPLLTLMKQSRAVGLGVVVATQNPVDLDYKGMANAATWMVGCLQTAQDRARVIEGLRLASAGWDSEELKSRFDQLKPRQFLVKAPQLQQPVQIQTRFAQALLRGPITKSELSKLQPVSPAPVTLTPGLPTSAPPEKELRQPPPLPQGLAQAFLDPEQVFAAKLDGAFAAWALPGREDGSLLFYPGLWAELELRFDEDKGGFVLDERHHYVVYPIPDGPDLAWRRLPLTASDLQSQWPQPACFNPLPESFDEAKELATAQKNLLEEVFKHVTSAQWVQTDLKLYGAGGESREAFTQRVEEAIQERVDQKLLQLHSKVQRQVNALEERLHRQQGRLEGLRNDSQLRQVESLWKAGAAVLGFFTGKKSAVSTALSSRQRSSAATHRLSQGEEEVEQLQRQLEQLQADLEAEANQIQQSERAALQNIEARPVRLERSDIRLLRFGILWIPLTRRLRGVLGGGAQPPLDQQGRGVLGGGAQPPLEA